MTREEFHAWKWTIIPRSIYICITLNLTIKDADEFARCRAAAAERKLVCGTVKVEVIEDSVFDCPVIYTARPSMQEDKNILTWKFEYVSSSIMSYL